MKFEIVDQPFPFHCEGLILLLILSVSLKDKVGKSRGEESSRSIYSGVSY